MGGNTVVGLKSYAKHLIRKLAGFEELNEKIDTLFFFLDTFADIQAAPQAEGSLRQLQLCDLLMLEIFDELCKSYHLNYWLDFGTLLGAVRHSGFIPWDDDLDVSMVRNDWNRAAAALPPILESMGFYVRVYSESWMGFGYKRDITGLWMDVFCYEGYSTDEPYDNVEEILRPYVREYLEFARKNNTFSTLPSITREQMRHRRYASIFSELAKPAGNRYYILSPELQFKAAYSVFLEEDIFPCSSTEFEGKEFPVPRNYRKFLTEQYGDYLHFPRRDVMHHRLAIGSLSDVADACGTDMNFVKKELVTIRNDLKKTVGAIGWSLPS